MGIAHDEIVAHLHLQHLAVLDAGSVAREQPFVHDERTTTEYEFLFVARGMLHVHIDQRTHTVHESEALLVRPGVAFGGTETSPPGLRLYYVEFEIPESVDAGGLWTEQWAEPKAISRPERLSELFRLLMDDIAVGLVTSQNARLMLLQILSEVTVPPVHNAQLAGCEDVLATRAKAYIRRHFAEQLTTVSVAAALEISPRYLGRSFCRAAGCSIKEFIVISRLFAARQLILDTDLSIKQIAHKCGFRDYAYFSRVFHKREGISPRNYRRLYSGRSYEF